MQTNLSQSEFYILLSLAIKSRHGYEIMKQVQNDSEGQVALGPGTLYGAIKRMLEADLITEVAGDEPRRKYYTLTELGRKSLSAELDRYRSVVELAKRERILGDVGVIQLSI